MILSAGFGCSKDKFQTTPSLRIKSMNANLLRPTLDSRLTITYEYTDKEGDIANDTLMYFPELLNKRRLSDPVGGKYFPIYESTPSFPKTSKGEIDLNLYGGNLYRNLVTRPGEDKNDTIRIRTVLYDNANNKSDTSYSEKIVILGQ